MAAQIADHLEERQNQSATRTISRTTTVATSAHPIRVHRGGQHRRQAAGYRSPRPRRGSHSDHRGQYEFHGSGRYGRVDLEQADGQEQDDQEEGGS